MRKYIICAIASSMLFLSCDEAKKKLGYEAENGKEVGIYVGDLESTDVIRKWFESYNARDLETVASIEHEDVVLYAPNGMIIKSSQEHTELAAQFLAAYPNAKWEVLWSISSDIDFKEKPSENWVTTCVTVSYGEGEEATTLQRIIDAQIVEGKIKTVYGYERSVSDEEADQNSEQSSKSLALVKKINLALAVLFSAALVLTETTLNTYYGDWEFAPLWIVDYLIAVILLSAVFVFKKQQSLVLLLGWSFSAGVTYMALFISLDPNGLNSEDIEMKLPLFVLALMISVVGLVLTLFDFK